MNKFFCFIGCLLLLFVIACGTPKVLEETKKVPTTDANGWESDRVYFKGIGTEPFWSISISEDAITWTTPESKIQFSGSAPMQSMDANVKRYVSEDGKGNRLELQILQKSCSDGMSNQDYAYQVKVQLVQKETTTYQGCGNYLLHEKLAGMWKLQTSTPTDIPIVLELDGTEMTFAGNAHCNRYFGSLYSEKNSLRLHNIGSTKIACAQKDLEQIYVEKLSQVTSYRLVNSQLILLLPNGEQLTFRAF
jgi:heat shock protein HslJ